MRLRTRLFLLVGGVVAVAVTLVTWSISTSARQSFETLDRQRTDALVLQFRRELATCGFTSAAQSNKMIRLFRFV